MRNWSPLRGEYRGRETGSFLLWTILTRVGCRLLILVIALISDVADLLNLLTMGLTATDIEVSQK
jgi:hypothetical protein